MWRGIYHYTIAAPDVQPKKAFEALSTIRAPSNDFLDEHAVVVWMIGGMKELLHFPKQLLPVSIHQSVSTFFLLRTSRPYMLKPFSLDVDLWSGIPLHSNNRL